MTERSIEAAFPLTPLQEGMLYHTIREPASGLFHVQCTGVLEGKLEAEHFVRAWELAVARHPALRTFLTWAGRERPLQVVRAHAELDVELLDWSDLDDESATARWSELARRDRERGFDLAVAPLMRVTVVRVAPDRHRLLWSMHHTIVDGWSALVVLDEVIRDHATLAAGGAPSVTCAPSFDRFVGWLEGQDRERDEAFWRKTLGGIAGPTTLPGGRPVRRSSARRVTTTHMLSEAETRRLTAAAARLRVTVNTLLMGAWAVMLARHAGADDVTFGATLSERPAELPDVERAVGLYLSTVPVRAPSQRGAAVGDWLRRLQLALSDARAHAAPGLAAMHRWSALPAATSLFDSLVVSENFPERAMQPFIAGDSSHRAASETLTLASAAMDVPNDIPLVLLALPGPRLVLNVVYDPDVVSDAIAAWLPSQLATALAELAVDASRSLDEVALLGAAERAQLDAWSGSRVVVPAAIDVVDRVRRHSAATPDAIALGTVREDITYDALQRHANRLAHRLLAAGLGDGAAGALVGILTDDPAEAIAAMLGVLEAGAAYVSLDTRAPNARLRRMVSPLQAVIAAPSLAPRIADAARTLPLDDAVGLPDVSPRGAVTPASAAYVIFTSGSTGEPKGVVVERGQLAASNAARDIYYPEPPQRFLLLSPVSVDSSVAGIYWTLGTGGTLVIPPPRVEQDIEALAGLVERARVTHTLLVPSLYRTLLEHADPRQLTSLECVIVAGEACPPEVVRLHHARLPHVALHNEYGPSEATVWATAGLLEDTGDERVSIGRPVPGARVYLLDDLSRPVPAGAVGEICIGGSAVARGYLGLPDETARRFVADPFVRSGRVYRTGDRGRFRPDGTLEFLGRSDEQIKVRGFRVEPGEIERVLAEYPGVREAAVALVRSPVPDDAATLVAALTALPDDMADRVLREAEAVA